MQEAMKARAKELLQSGEVSRVLGWRRGEFAYDVTPAFFEDEAALEADFVYDAFCGANLSKYLIRTGRMEGRTLVFLKPCDTYSYNQLVKEHRVQPEKVYVIALACNGMADVEKIRAAGFDGPVGITEQGDDFVVQTLYDAAPLPREKALAERCLTCKSRLPVAGDETLGQPQGAGPLDRFAGVEALENSTAEERYEFWRGELSRCIRCNACRNVCPACSCEQCVFDNKKSGVANTAPADPFEENLFHIIRAFHVAGRCTDCGECSRVCPQHIPLHLLNRKFIKDINELYGPYQAGADTESRAPLTNFTEQDCEPGIVHERGVK